MWSDNVGFFQSRKKMREMKLKERLDKAHKEAEEFNTKQEFKRIDNAKYHFMEKKKFAYVGYDWEDYDKLYPKLRYDEEYRCNILTQKCTYDSCIGCIFAIKELGLNIIINKQ